jgi:AraC-like DNA-binding protein/mannose-6-phosphate isomerase-like protein (cupin superfamily)
VSHPVERYSVDDLLARRSEIRVMAPRLGNVAVHWHDFYELGYVVDGVARHVVNGVEGVLEPGSAFLLSPADFHEIVPTSDVPLSCYNVVVGPDVLERHLDELVPIGTDWEPWTAHGFDEAAADFERLAREGADDAPGREIVMDAVLRCIVVELARRADAASTGQNESAPGPTVGGQDVRRAVAFVERHFREPITLADAAAVAHLSPNYFSERFRATTGTAFQVYLQNRRLQFARSLLASIGRSSMSVADVCHAAGFNNLSHFGRAYRRRYGESPSATPRHHEVTSTPHS